MALLGGDEIVTAHKRVYAQSDHTRLLGRRRKSHPRQARSRQLDDETIRVFAYSD
jgi:hypothetical protein